MYPRLVSKSRFSCLNLPNAGIIGINHHAWQSPLFGICLIGLLFLHWKTKLRVEKKNRKKKKAIR
jgi:hypothetical protein